MTDKKKGEKRLEKRVREREREKRKVGLAAGSHTHSLPSSLKRLWSDELHDEEERE